VAVDITVNFCAQAFTPETMFDCIEPRSSIVYMISGSARPLSGNRPFFSLWAKHHVELPDTCKRLSFRVERVYTCWKCEHGGGAGYRIYDKGLELAEQDGASEPTLLLEGFHECFGEPLSISKGKVAFFPEVLFDEPLECWLFDFESGRCSEQNSSIVKRLLESDIDAEPVFPFEL
jgi:hypothetical protein